MDGTKFWLSPESQRFGREPMEENHEDIGRRVLNQLRLNYDHRARDGLYVVLFGLNYLRGVEYTEMRNIYVENDGLHDMTRRQQEYLDERCLQLGARDKPWTVHFNDRLFIETRSRITHAECDWLHWSSWNEK